MGGFLDYMDKWMDGWIDEWMDGWMGRWLGWWLGGWEGGSMYRWVDGFMDGWVDGCMGCEVDYKETNNQIDQLINKCHHIFPFKPTPSTYFHICGFSPDSHQIKLGEYLLLGQKM